MHYEYVAIPDAEVPQGVEPAFQHAVATYASEVNKTISVWRAVPDRLLDFQPHAKVNTIRTIFTHQLLSERRFFAAFVGLEEPAVEELLPPGEKPAVPSYIEKYAWLAKRRLPQFAQGTTAWWLEERQFFGGLRRQRVWVFWRRVLHTCHHRTQVQTWLRLAGHEPVPAIYGPSGDVTWDAADPTYSLEAAKRGGTANVSGAGTTKGHRTMAEKIDTTGRADLGLAQLRVARPTDDLKAVVRFYRDGLGLDVLYEFRDHDGFDGVMLGRKGAGYHLEFTRKAGHHVGKAPTGDNLLVFYLPDRAEWQRAIDRLERHGYQSVPAFNPYWDRHGKTFADPDGYRVVLQNAAWPA